MGQNYNYLRRETIAMSNISKEQRDAEIISQVSTGQRVHDIALLLFERYLIDKKISVECDCENVKTQVKTYETFHNWVLNDLNL